MTVDDMGMILDWTTGGSQVAADGKNPFSLTVKGVVVMGPQSSTAGSTTCWRQCWDQTLGKVGWQQRPHQRWI